MRHSLPNDLRVRSIEVQCGWPIGACTAESARAAACDAAPARRRYLSRRRYRGASLANEVEKAVDVHDGHIGL